MCVCVYVALCLMRKYVYAMIIICLCLWNTNIYTFHSQSFHLLCQHFGFFGQLIKSRDDMFVKKKGLFFSFVLSSIFLFFGPFRILFYIFCVLLWVGRIPSKLTPQLLRRLLFSISVLIFASSATIRLACSFDSFW